MKRVWSDNADSNLCSNTIPCTTIMIYEVSTERREKRREGRWRNRNVGKRMQQIT